MSFWADACNDARNKSLQAHLDAVTASCSVTVTRLSTLNAWHACCVGRVTFCRAGHRVWHERFCKRRHVFAVVVDRPRGATTRLAAVRMVLRARALRQLRGRSNLERVDAVSCQSFSGKRPIHFTDTKRAAQLGCLAVARGLHRHVPP